MGTTGRIEAVLLCLAKDNETIMKFIDCLEGWYTETLLGTTHFRKGYILSSSAGVNTSICRAALKYLWM